MSQVSIAGAITINSIAGPDTTNAIQGIGTGADVQLSPLLTGGGRLLLNGGSSSVNATGGDIKIQPGDGTGASGSITLLSGTGSTMLKFQNCIIPSYEGSGTSDMLVVGSGGGTTVSYKNGPAGAIVGDADTQTLTNKTISGTNNTISGLSYTTIQGLTPNALVISNVSGGLGTESTLASAFVVASHANWPIVANSSSQLTAVPYISAAQGGTDIDTSASTGIAQVASGTWSVGSLALTSSELTGILPVGSGGTNSGGALSNGKLMISSAGTIIEGTSSAAPVFATSVGSPIGAFDTLNGKTTSNTLGYFGGQKIEYYGTLVGATGMSVYILQTIATASNVGYDVEYFIMYYCTASVANANTGKTLSQYTRSRYKNIGGTLTLSGLYYQNALNHDTGVNNGGSLQANASVTTSVDFCANQTLTTDTYDVTWNIVMRTVS